MIFLFHFFTYLHHMYMNVPMNVIYIIYMIIKRLFNWLVDFILFFIRDHFFIFYVRRSKECHFNVRDAFVRKMSLKNLLDFKVLNFSRKLFKLFKLLRIQIFCNVFLDLVFSKIELNDERFFLKNTLNKFE